MKKGIAMVTLVVIISVMLILVSVITVSGVNVSNTSKKLSFASEIKMLQDCVNTYRTTNNNELPITDFVVIDLSSASDDVKKQFQTNLEDITDDNVYLNKIDYTKLDVSNLSRGLSESDEDIYVVSSKTGIVYYAKGLKIGNQTYYTLTDELKKLLNYNSKSNELLADNAIVCEMNTNDWTNMNVSVNIKVPKEYVNVTVSVGENIAQIDSNIIDEEYNIYNFEVVENCNINVNYTDQNDMSKNSKFIVGNIDKTLPDLVVNNIINSNNNKKYIEVKGTDLQSGIKIIKYDTDKIDNDEIGIIYFNNNGIEVKNNIIEIDNDIPYITVYVEDNAGNCKISLVNT